MSDYKILKKPDWGTKISLGKDGNLEVPDDPIIPFIAGDGIGPDIWKASVRVFDGAVEKAYKGKKKISWFEVHAGEKGKELHDEWLPKETLRAIEEHLVAIKGPLTTPVGGGFRSLNVSLRKIFDLYACVRPVRYFKGVPSPVKKPELVNFSRDCREGFWYDYKDLIYKDTPKCSWYLVKKDLIVNNPRPQIDDDEEMLSPVEIIFMLVLFQQVRNSRLFSDTYLRCVKRDYRLGEQIISNAYIDTSKPGIRIFHPFNYQPVTPQAIVIFRKPALFH